MVRFLLVLLLVINCMPKLIATVNNMETEVTQEFIAKIEPIIKNIAAVNVVSNVQFENIDDDVITTNASISFDGKYLLIFISNDEMIPQTYLVNLSNGNTKVILRKHATKNMYQYYTQQLTFSDMAYWDPKDATRIYIRTFEHPVELQKGDITEDMINRRYYYWNLSINDFSEMHVETSFKSTVVLTHSPNCSVLLIGGTNSLDPDESVNMYKLIYNSGEEKIIKTDYYPYVFSPDSKKCASYEFNEKHNTYEVNIAYVDTGKFITPFTANQVRQIPADKTPMLEGSVICWLPNSEGVLINVSADWSGRDDNEIWYISCEGEARRISNKVKIIANSPDSRYWLFEFKSRMYLVEAKM